MHEKNVITMLFMVVKYRQFFKFCHVEALYLKNVGHAKNFIFCSTSSKSAQKCIGIKKDYNFFYYLTPITKFCPLAKDCRDPKFIPNFFIVFFFFFFIVQTPFYQNLKSKLGDNLLHTGVTPATGLYKYDITP